jgi:protein-L-isoaspartate(D-aspartate) O-methyltransferase
MTPDFKTARINMVENQVRTNDVTDLPIQDAMRLIPREGLCPAGKSYLAYAEADVEYAPGLYLMQPREVSKLLQMVYPLRGERALAIAAPYAAAVLAWMGLEVTLQLPEGVDGPAIVQALGQRGVTPTARDLASPADGGPYDIVLCEGAVPDAPKAWLDAVAIGGRLGVVEREGPVGKAKLYVRGDDGLISGREVFDASPQRLPGFARAPSFAF